MAKRYPKTLGACIDRLYREKAERITLGKQVDKMKSAEYALREHILQQFPKAKLKAASGKVGAVARTEKDMPRVTDWEAVHDFIHENDAYDLFQRRLHEGAVAERWAEGVEIPGVDRFKKVDLSVTKAKGKGSK